MSPDKLERLKNLPETWECSKERKLIMKKWITHFSRPYTAISIALFDEIISGEFNVIFFTLKYCHPQYAILSERNSKVPSRIEPLMETLLQGGYHYIVPLHNRWGYIQRAYSATRIHQTSYMGTTADYRCNTNRNSNEIHTASPGCRPGTYPKIDEEEELQNKQTSLSRHDHRITCTCNYWCSNLWGTRTQQSHYHGHQD